MMQNHVYYVQDLDEILILTIDAWGSGTVSVESMLNMEYLGEL